MTYNETLDIIFSNQKINSQAFLYKKEHETFQFVKNTSIKRYDSNQRFVICHKTDEYYMKKTSVIPFIVYRVEDNNETIKKLSRLSFAKNTVKVEQEWLQSIIDRIFPLSSGHFLIIKYISERIGLSEYSVVCENHTSYTLWETLLHEIDDVRDISIRNDQGFIC